MKLVLDVKDKNEIKENDLIVYKNGNWEVVSRESFLAKYINDQRLLNKEYKQKIEKLQKDLVNLAKIVKEK